MYLVIKRNFFSNIWLGLLYSILLHIDWICFRGCFLTNSLIATLALSLTIPLSMVADSVVKEIEFSALFYIGSLPVLISFVAVALLAHYDNWDPIMVAFRRLSVSICYRKKPVRYSENHNLCPLFSCKTCSPKCSLVFQRWNLHVTPTFGKWKKLMQEYLLRSNFSVVK